MLIAVASAPPYGLTTYAVIWLIIGLILLVAIAAWYGAVFWLTRKKPVSSIADLKLLTSPLDLNALKAKYIKIVDEYYLQYEQHEVSRRALHRNLSIAVRYFVYEANHFPAPNLTLYDIRRAPYPNLTNLIRKYYVDEFAVIESGEPLLSAQAAKGVIQQWV